MPLEKRQIFAFGVAFIIGATVFSALWSPISPASDLKLSLVGIDTAVGTIDSGRSGELAEVSNWDATQIWIDPDRKGDTSFTFTTRHTTTIRDMISNSKCGKPDIIATITEPVPVIHSGIPRPSIKSDKTEFDYQGQHYELLKTTFEVMLKTMGDSYADTIYAEIAHKEEIVLTGISTTPPVGDIWKGNVYLQYTIQNQPGAFIYEVYINKKPKVGRITEDEIDTTLSLKASAVPAVALASYEQYDAVAFYESFEGNEMHDLDYSLTNTGVMSLGGTLGVGADPIMEKHTWPLPDTFKGWNLYDTAIQYQIAVVIALPVAVDEDGNSTGDIVDPDTGLLTGESMDDIMGSQREGEQGDASYYRTNVEDTESLLDKVLDDLDLGDLNKTIQLALLAIVVIGVSIAGFYVFMWFFPLKR